MAVAHGLDAAAARAAVERAFAHYKSKYAHYKPTLKWLDTARAEVAFAAKGVVVRGVLRLEAGRAVMDAKVPMLLRPFTKRAVARIEGELGKWLNGARGGDDEL